MLLFSALLAFVAITVYISLSVRSARMKERRSGLNEDSFIYSLVIYGFDAEIARTTFRYLQTTQQISFPIQASDLLDEDLGLNSDDLEETVRDLFHLTGRRYQPGRRHTPLTTVEDMVRFLQASPRRSALAA